MDWTLKEERQELKRIVVLLFSFANLAEHSCSRSAAMRGLVLWLLRRAEPVALKLVTSVSDAPPAQPFADGFSPADAMRLAQRFRALACVLSRQVALVCARDDCGSVEPRWLTALGMQDVANLVRAMLRSASASRRPNLPCGTHLPDTS